MKIWNLNEFTGVVGAFNCQGAGWCKDEKKYLIHDQQPGTITGYVRTNDVHYLHKVAAFEWTGDSIIYSHLRGKYTKVRHQSKYSNFFTHKFTFFFSFLCEFALPGELVYLPKDTSLPVTLKSREYEVFTVVPVKEFSNGNKFAPVGLTEMFNSGGAIVSLRYADDGTNFVIRMKLRGSGVVGIYSSLRPRNVTVDSDDVEYRYEPESGLVTFTLGVPEIELYLWDVVIEL